MLIFVNFLRKNMSLQHLLAKNEKNIKEIESFVEESFKKTKEIALSHENQPPKPAEISEIFVETTKFPIDLQIPANIRNFFENGVLRPFESKKLKLLLESLFSCEKTHKLLEK